MSAPAPIDTGTVRSGACPCCGRPALVELETGREIRGCYCAWTITRYAKRSDTVMVPVRTTGIGGSGLR